MARKAKSIAEQKAELKAQILKLHDKLQIEACLYLLQKYHRTSLDSVEYSCNKRAINMQDYYDKHLLNHYAYCESSLSSLTDPHTKEKLNLGKLDPVNWLRAVLLYYNYHRDGVVVNPRYNPPIFAEVVRKTKRPKLTKREQAWEDVKFGK